MWYLHLYGLTSRSLHLTIFLNNISQMWYLHFFFLFFCTSQSGFMNSCVPWHFGLGLPVSYTRNDFQLFLDGVLSPLALCWHRCHRQKSSSQRFEIDNCRSCCSMRTDDIASKSDHIYTNVWILIAIITLRASNRLDRFIRLAHEYAALKGFICEKHGAGRLNAVLIALLVWKPGHYLRKSKQDNRTFELRGIEGWKSE